MTTVKTQINGQPFEITIDDGLTLEFSEAGVRVSGKSTESTDVTNHYHYSYGQLWWQQYPPSLPVQPLQPLSPFTVAAQTFQPNACGQTFNIAGETKLLVS